MSSGAAAALSCDVSTMPLHHSKHLQSIPGMPKNVSWVVPGAGCHYSHIHCDLQLMKNHPAARAFTRLI